MIEPTGRVVMISGASRGIGLAIARVLHAKGYSVSVGARNVAALEQALTDRAGARLVCARYEAGDRASHQAWLEQTLNAFGRLDALVNNAGTSNTFSIEAGEEADLDALWTINVKGPLFLTRICLPHLKAAGSGRIINVASLSGKRVRNDNIAYSMTKHAVLALTHGTRRIGWDYGVRATALCPGFVATDLTADVTKVSQAEMIDPLDLAELAATAIALPNTAAIAEMLVNCRLEDTL
ncbi:SDR family NAD(P)-dependent oxidoreductase [Sedimentitalea nanhaiensis]|uniref:NADP-dependent 3-hydroxy acid dehydrogenase YdfG n=1 Tax=Sedimentitalea nanhaiensis TaxID=999627 RepID=A0A1I7D8Z4_9RHOB|nr:SDR family NAD(P)-dependent oxidoreductase [Sedimentitalea nanhaiensis]SFU08126.1 NADP-dependent 3-hydroxy acid dehydrogenase YdfG [Sedimentitalea nanhaiensis]